MLFVGSQVAIIILGSLPLANWRSFGPAQRAPARVKPATAG